MSAVWYAASKCSLYWDSNLYLYFCWAGNEHVLYKTARTDIRLKKCYVHWIKVKELISAGMWNSISRLSQVLSDGLDLVITNIWISAYLMGELSIAQQIPTYISTLTNTLINLFSPNLTMYYAKDDTEAVVKELKLSMKFSSFFVNIIFCILVIFGKYFMQTMGAESDVNLIYSLLVVIMMSLLVSGVTTSLNNVFLVTNRLKVNSIFWLIISFTNVLFGVHLLKHYITWNFMR